MIGQNFDIVAQLVVTINQIRFVVVAQENYILINFPDFKSLEAMTKLELPDLFSEEKTLKPKPKASKKSGGGPLKKLQEVNDKVLELGLVIDVRVNNKTYVELGSGRSARITAAAIFGKIGSFFG